MGCCCPCWSRSSHDYSEIPTLPDDSLSLNGHKKKKECHVVFQSEVPPIQPIRSPPTPPPTLKITSTQPERLSSSLSSPIIDNSIKLTQDLIQTSDEIVDLAPQSDIKSLHQIMTTISEQAIEEPINFEIEEPIPKIETTPIEPPAHQDLIPPLEELIETEESIPEIQTTPAELPAQQDLIPPLEELIYLGLEQSNPQIYQGTTQIDQEEQKTEPPPGSIKCKKCEQFKESDDFSKNQLKKFKNAPTCKTCLQNT